MDTRGGLIKLPDSPSVSELKNALFIAFARQKRVYRLADNSNFMSYYNTAE